MFAAIALFLGLRLYNVLGKRHGDERQRPTTPFERKSDDARGKPAAERDTVIPFPGSARGDEAAAGQGEEEAFEGPVSIAAQITRVEKADPSFNENDFLHGARAAFSMIVEGFARGDRALLKPLLAPPVYSAFDQAIGEREAAGQVRKTEISSVDEADIVFASIEGGQIRIEVRLVSHQIDVTTDADGAVMEGDAHEVHEVVDLWTFARKVRSPDPNWMLVATRVPS
ncbi:Tim44/TimA family putative adaptor protein [Radicibacter daui]|uniref:Tim44/TimA family putative adaptor protein n=1 Tax=Radicibacter daui TaxID=3064829 RepID=UPI004046C613